MPLSYILKRVGSKMGLNPSIIEQRDVLLGFINEAADELYTQSDMEGSVVEATFKVNGDQTISMPLYVGAIRAMREADSRVAWHLNKIRPHYNQISWQDAWRNYRLIGKKPTVCSITNQSRVTVRVPSVEAPNITVVVTGTTDTATNAIDNFILSTAEQTGNHNFTSITSITKDRVNDVDVTIEDADGLVLSVIPNNQLSSQYLIIDVSECPWLAQSTSAQDHYMEILFKKSLTWLQNDEDEFPAQGYDNIIVNKVLQLWNEEKENIEGATAYDNKATRSLARKHEDANRGTEDLVALVTNPHDSLFPRVNGGRYRRRVAGSWWRF